MTSTERLASPRSKRPGGSASHPTIGGRELVPGEWAVLGLLAEAPAHGFALSKALASGGEIGVIWTVPRQLVYRTLGVLEENELVHPIATEAGPGPVRTIMSVTPLGRHAVRRWLAQPVAHVRDARSLLMLKLVFLERSGRDMRPLLERQREVLLPAAAAQHERAMTASGWQHTVELWRSECVDAVISFTERVLATNAAEDGSRAHPGNVRGGRRRAPAQSRSGSRRSA